MVPLINSAAVAKVRDHIADATGKGDRHRLGRQPPTRLAGPSLNPPILTGVTPDMVGCHANETFGPVAPLFRFEKEADVIAEAANDTEFGLASYIYTRDHGAQSGVSLRRWITGWSA